MVESILHAENDQVRVTEWRLAPSDRTGHHRHNWDYVVVPLTDATVKAISADGEALAQMSAGVAYFRKAGVEHDIINVGELPLAFVEVELKDHPG